MPEKRKLLHVSFPIYRIIIAIWTATPLEYLECRFRRVAGPFAQSRP